MNTAKILHDASIDMVIEANKAKAKGDNKLYNELLFKAFTLEKEAALKVQFDVNDEFWRFVLIRSAAWLAFNCGKYEEAIALISLGRSGKPPHSVLNEFVELEKVLNEKYSLSNAANYNNKWQIIGVLTSANRNKCEIKIQQSTEDTFTVLVPENLIEEIVKMYWGEAVKIEAEKTEKGMVRLKDIKRAA